MIRGKLSQYFGESITKLNKIIFNLDTQMGVVSDLGHSAALSSKSVNVMMCNKVNMETSKHHQTENTNIQTETKVEEKPKKENKKAKKAPEENDLFRECDLRVGRVKEISAPENLNDIYYLKVDLGEENLREIGTGLKKYLPSEEFHNKLVIIFANLKPKKLNTFFSNGMILSSFDEKGEVFELVRPDESK
jgi:aminoacyl tRNA synthase complex-interacting multifunctional protein 1